MEFCPGGAPSTSATQWVLQASYPRDIPQSPRGCQLSLVSCPASPPPVLSTCPSTPSNRVEGAVTPATSLGRQRAQSILTGPTGSRSSEQLGSGAPFP